MLALLTSLFLLYIAALFGRTERLGITRGLPPADFPDSCEGLVTIGGQYDISAEHIVNATHSRGCIIHAEHGTLLMLSAPLHFVGDVRLTGRMQVVAQEDMMSDSCFVVKGSLSLEMDLRMRGCRSIGRGGALRTLGDVTITGSKLDFEDCHANQGGAIFVHGSAHMIGGEATFTNCTAGGSKAEKAANKLLHSISRTREKQSQYCGGGLAVDGSLVLQRARIAFHHCRATDSGGGLWVQVKGSFYAEGAAINFNGCTSGEQGGGMFLGCSRAGPSSCGINQSSLVFRSCSSNNGGGLSLSGDLGLVHSNASFEKCQSATRGGGLWLRRMSAVSAQYVSLEFKQCAAGQYGGGLQFSNANVSLDESDVTFVGCSGRYGGGFESSGGRLVHRRGRMSFHSCEAFEGAAFDSALGAELAEVDIDMCTGLGAAVASSIGNVSIQRLTFAYDAPSAGYEANLVAPTVSISEANCTAVHQCTVHAATARIGSIFCPPGREMHTTLRHGLTRHGCKLCDPGYFQPLPWHNPHCFPCPSEALACDAASMTMQAGYMLHVPNLSSITDFSELDSVKLTYFCANAAACPGGRLAYQNQTAMCSHGTTGEGCEWSAPGYATGDFGNPYVKIKCPDSHSAWVRAASYLFGKDLFLFALASSSVLGARAGRKDSAVFVNLFMAFGTVVSRCLMALMQCEEFAGQRLFLQDLLVGWGMLIDVGSGQTTAGTSFFCFTTALYGNSGPKLFWTNFVLSAVPGLLLVSVLGCVKGLWLSIIVGSNCFLPALCARVAMLLIAFRQTKGGRITFFYPVDEGELWAYVLAVALVLTIFFCAATWSWLRATHSDQDPRSLHVLYLAAPYKPNYASWEVERLLRKMTLGVICGAFPTTVHPKTQLFLVAFIMILSAALYFKLQPYSQAKFNDMEISLLLAGTAMIVLTLLCLHGDANWATHLPVVKLTAGASAVAIAIGCTLRMAMLIVAAFMKERKKE